MSLAIVYCEKCGKIIPPGEDTRRKAIVGEYMGVCPACVAALAPGDREELERRLLGQPRPKRRAPKPRAFQKTDGRTATRLAGPRSRPAIIIAGVAAGGLVAVVTVVALAPGPPRSRPGKRETSAAHTRDTAVGTGDPRDTTDVTAAPRRGVDGIEPMIDPPPVGYAEARGAREAWKEIAAAAEGEGLSRERAREVLAKLAEYAGKYGETDFARSKADEIGSLRHRLTDLARPPARKVGIHYFSDYPDRINEKCGWGKDCDSRCYAWKPAGSNRDSAVIQTDNQDAVEGPRSLRFVINRGHSRWVLEMSPKVGTGTVDLSRFRRLGMSLKSEAARDWDAFSVIIASAGGGSYSVPVSKIGFKPDGKWHACTIDLRDVAGAGVDLSRVGKIIQFAWGGGVEDGDTFKLDDLHFVE